MYLMVGLSYLIDKRELTSLLLISSFEGRIIVDKTDEAYEIYTLDCTERFIGDGPGMHCRCQ